MATRPPLRARTVSCVLWNEGGCRRLTLRSFGIPRFEVRCASIRQPLVLSCRSPTGLSKTEIIDRTRAPFEKKELPPLESGAMCYMMSKEAYLTDEDDHNMAHLMFYTTLMNGADWGADLPN